MAESKQRNRDSTELDSVDWAILHRLQVDATVPNKELARQVHLAPSTCLERVRRLKASGVISSIRAVVDPSRVGRGEQALLAIRIRPHSRQSADDFVTRALGLPETVALYNVSGEEDYLLHVAVRDSTALQSLIIDRLLLLPQVAHCKTQLIFDRPMTSPVSKLPDD